MNQTIHIDKICRACLVENVSESINWSSPLATAKLENITYMECFQRYTLLDVDSTDQLPQLLCLDCATQLCDTYDFIRKATESHQTLLLKLLSLQLTEETEAENFEYVTVEQTDNDDDDDDDNNDVLLTVYKTSHAGKAISLKLERRLTVDTDIIDDYDSATSLNNSTLVRNDIEETIPSANTLEKRKRGRPKSTFSTEIEKFDSQDEHMVKCDFCNGTFTQKQIKRHVSRVHNVKMLLCHACPRTFKDASSLRHHTLTHEENRQRNYTCEHCGNKFLTKTSYQNHVKIHDTNRKAAFQCQHCEKSFFHKGSLKLHMLYHTGETLECKICAKRYPRLVDLEIHLRSHSGNMPYKCQYCDKAFTQAGILNKHVRHHEGYRYKCDICNKEYLHQSTLIQHRKEHMGLPLKCLICGKGFVKKSKMKRHISGVHKVKSNEKMEEFIQKVKTKREYRGRILETA